MSCPRCGGLLIVETNATNSNPDKILNRYPEGRVGPDIDHLPGDVADYFDQAHRAMDAKLPDAAAVALRRTLEAAASHFSHEEGVLVKRIQGLIDDGLVTKQFGEVLHHVRQIGNIGAHASDKKVTENQAQGVMEFTTQVLRNLFEIPGRLKELRGEPADPDA